MKRRTIVTAVVMVAMVLALAATPVMASHETVVAISGEVVAVDGSGFTVQIGAQASGPANALSGQGFDNPGKPGAPPTPVGYCRFPLSGSLVGSVVTLSGTVTFSTNPALVGAPVTIIADSSSGAITFDFAGFVLTGTGSVVIAHQ